MSAERERFEAGKVDIFYHSEGDTYLGSGDPENYLVFAEYDPEAGCKIYGLFTSYTLANEARVRGDESRDPGEPLADAVILRLPHNKFRAGRSGVRQNPTGGEAMSRFWRGLPWYGKALLVAWLLGIVILFATNFRWELV